jgi:gliding motility-associated-like protein
MRPLLRLALLFLVPIQLSAQGVLRFTENKGQWPSSVTHRAELSGATVWCEKGSLLIDLYDADLVHSMHGNTRSDHMDAGLRHHAVRLKFLNTSADLKTTGLYRLSGQSNYFIGNDPAKWAGNALSYSSVTLHGIAPGCNAIVREGRSGLKYDLILAPAADPNTVAFTYEGADEIELRDGALIISTSLGRMIERIPIAYQEIDGERRIIECRYTLKNGVIGIQPGTYDPTRELVIDPTLEFATFSGSFSNNFGYTATFDNAGFLYAGSTAFGNQYPVTTGAYQTSWAGGTTDIAITKYDTTGMFLIWSTYLGGSSSEMPHSLIVDENDRITVLGTTSSADFPTTATAFDDSFGGGTPFVPDGLGVNFGQGSDMIVARLNSTGSALLGSTFIGGSANDGLNSGAGLKFNYADEVRGEVLLSDEDKIWIVSTTQSTDMPLAGTPAQAIFGGGTHDGYVARFNGDLSQLEYSSYIGGGAADAVYAGEIDESGRLFVCGGTTSSDLPASGTAHDPSFNGGTADAFAARFTADGSSIDRLTYWGSTAYDQAYFVELDGDGDVYLFGQTSAPSGQLTFNAGYVIPAGGQFISKFDPELSQLMMSSRIGAGDGTPDISPTAFLVDVCNKIYTSGWGSSTPGLGGSLTTAGLPISSDAHQSNTDGHDLYLAVFEINMSSFVYATYYGGQISAEHVDGGTSRFDRRGRVYQSVCAGCQNNDDFPTSPGAWSSTNNSTGCNNGLLKFDFDAPLVIASFLAPDTACADGTIPFTNLSNGVSYSWDFGDGDSSSLYSPTHTYSSAGTYVVWLTVMDPNSCNEIDSISRTIVIEGAAPQLQVMNDTLICGPVDSFTLIATSFGSADAYHWSSNNEFSDMLNAAPQDSIAIISPPASGTYFIQAGSSSVCNVRDSVTVTVQFASPAITGDSLICSNDVATLTLTGIDAGATILWSPADEILTGQGTASITTSPEDDLVFGVEVSTPEGCSWSGSISVSVSVIEGSSVTASADPTIVLPGASVQLNATPADGVNYSWSPANLLNDPAIAAPTAVVQQTTTFVVTVSDGICTKDASVTVTVYELRCEEPDIFVPNTFTPNGDGNNDVLFVRGQHITDLEFMIFDRWGEKVFETKDRSIGWDGTYKGMAVDPAVFVYHLTAFCVGGQRYFTKGNVTVAR